MKKRDIRFASIPSTEEVAAERERLAYQNRYQRVLRSTVYILVVVAAVAVLLATLFLPVLQVSGDSMNPTLNDKDIILLVKSNHIENGELCGFYWQNKLLLKRIIGQPGDVIDMDVNGVVSVNGEVLDEPYVDALTVGECDIRFPYQVPENRYFVLGDHRICAGACHDHHPVRQLAAARRWHLYDRAVPVRRGGARPHGGLLRQGADLRLHGRPA